MSANPLVQYRAPKNFRRADVENGYFQMKYGDIANDGDTVSRIYPSDFRFIPNPSLELDFKVWEDTENSMQAGQDARLFSFKTFMRLTRLDGYQVAMAKDFEIDPRVAMIWKADGGGRITMNGAGRQSSALVLMWATGEQYDTNQSRRLKFSDQVQKHALQDQESADAQREVLQAKLDAAGIPGEAVVTIEDDDGRTALPRRGIGRRK